MSRAKFYKEVDGQLEEFSEYDSDFMDSFRNGNTLVVKKKNCTMRKYDVDPDYASIVAAFMLLNDDSVSRIMERTKARPSTTPITPEQREAWDYMEKTMGKSMYMTWPSVQEVLEIVAEEAASAITDRELPGPVLDAIAYLEATIELTNGK